MQGLQKPFACDDAMAQTMERACVLSVRQIQRSLTGLTSDVAQAALHAIEGGKGLRAFLVLESAHLYGIDAEKAASAAGAIEALHAYSLVHDDLPCLDNDDTRRGRPTVHVKWDEATAILAGDALHSLAFELIAQVGVSAENRLILSTTLAQAAGIRGMVGGQERDIAAETALTQLSLDDIITLQAGKTGALIRWSAKAGAQMAGVDSAPLETFGASLGLAFQITDDILDVTGDEGTVGKAVGKDASAGKATFISHLGLDGAQKYAEEQISQACEALSDFGPAADQLRAAARFVLARKY